MNNNYCSKGYNVPKNMGTLYTFAHFLKYNIFASSAH